MTSVLSLGCRVGRPIFRDLAEPFDISRRDAERIFDEVADAVSMCAQHGRQGAGISAAVLNAGRAGLVPMKNFSKTALFWL